MDMNITKIIIHEIKTCGKSRYQISKETGISQAALFKINNGRPCTSETADILLAYFGYELKKRKRG